MNSPAVWIVAPAVLAVLLFFLRDYKRWIAWLAASFSAVFALAAWRVPIAEPFAVGPWTIQISDSLVILGRSFSLASSDSPLLVLIFLLAGIWFGGAGLISTGPFFIPLGMGMIALLTATLAVDPFLYAALFIELTVLLSVPILVDPGSHAKRAVLRLLTYQTLGVPFVLFSGWLLSGVEASPGDLDLVVRASVLLGFGFAILMAVFPFHTWIPMLMAEVDPYVAGYVLFFFPSVISLFGLGFLDRYAWLRTSETVQSLFLVAGLVMVLTGGIWAAVQRHLGRMLGYAVIIEVGMGLLAMSTVPSAGVEAFFALLIFRGMGIFIWSLGLSVLGKQYPDLAFRTVQGAGRRFPVIAAGIVLAHLSMAGLPLLAAFPVRLALWESLASVVPLAALGSLLGSTGLMVGGLRTMAVLVMERDPQDVSTEIAVPVRLIFLFGGILFVVLGLSPTWFSGLAIRLAVAFPSLFP